MSDRTYEDRLATRVLDAIDALPVPTGPHALRQRGTLVRRFDPMPVVALIVIAVAVTLATPGGQSFVADAGRFIQRVIGAAQWGVYYIESPDSGNTWELMFTSDTFPGRPTQPAVRSFVFTTPASVGGDRWSPDGELFATAAGAKIFVGDRLGRIREVAEAGEYRQVGELAWTGRRRLLGVSRAADRTASDVLISVDVDRGIVTERTLPEGVRIDPRPGHVWGTFSPSGRWLIIPDGGSLTCRSMRIMDLATDRIVEMADGTEKRAMPIGWLSGDRLVWGTCVGPTDASGATHVLNVSIGEPGSEGRSIGSVPWSTDPRASSRTHLQAAPIVDIHRDRILIPSARRDGVDGGSVWALDLNGRLTELAPLPRVSDVEPDATYSRIVALRPISRDGRWMAIQFTAVLDPSGGYGRTGVLDLTTGAITWACDAGTRTGSRYAVGPTCNGLQVR